MGLKIEQFMCRDDNFGVLIRDDASGLVAAIDAPEEAPIRAALDRNGWKLTHILVTHHHPDHVEGIPGLKADFSAEIIGPADEADKIAGLDRMVGDGDKFDFGSEQVHVISTPGHTAGHICLHFPASKVIFTADTLFALGCGRLFERGPDVMYESLSKLVVLPRDTVVYCGHEYTESNAKFAVTVDPHNKALADRAARISRLRAEGKPTLPTTIAEELETNPFVRWDDAGIRRHLGMENATNAEVFAEIRKRKDNF